ncbi:MAG: hypothetical protein ACRD1D_17750, partial [Acidimicrobiales bacterium]
MTGRPTGGQPSWLAGILACPRCHGGLVEQDGRWTCGRCGDVGRSNLGFPDFLAGVDSLPMAGGDAMDVAADTRAGAELAEAAATAGFAELARRA